MSTPFKHSRPKGKRGRPALKIQKTTDSLSPTHSLRSVLEGYETSKVSYECSLYTQQLCLMIQRIAVSPALAPFTKEPLNQFLLKAVKEVMLTELEVALWSLVLERTEAQSRDLDLLLYFRISAYAVRRVTEGEAILSDVEAYLDTKPGFQRTFGKWFEGQKDRLEVPLLEVNQRFVTLTQPLGPQDCHPYLYALLIDEIIDEPFAANDTLEEEEAARDRMQGRGQLPELPGVPSLEPLDGFEPFRDFQTYKKED